VLVAAAVLPHAPVLVPALAAGAAPELDDLRARCRDALDIVAQARPDLTFVVGVEGGVHARSFAPWGVADQVDVPEPLPLSLLVGAWFTAGSSRSFVVVDDDLDAGECASLGAELAESAQRVGLVVMGDGSARHSDKAPGYLDVRAAPYDDAVAGALRTADARALLALDPELSRQLLVAGRAPWQVLAGAAGPGPWDNATATTSAPYGVAYHVAVWT
jgi:hypothetical protein